VVAGAPELVDDDLRVDIGPDLAALLRGAQPGDGEVPAGA